MLKRKMIREIRLHFTQFLTIFLMVFLGMFIFSGIRSYMDGMKISRSNYYKENTVLDLYVQQQGVTDEDLNKIKSLSGVSNVERKATVIGSETKNDHALQVNFIEGNQISRFHVVEGSGFSYDSDGIWVDSYYAESNHLSPGDTIKIKVLDQTWEKKIIGLIMVPDHIYDVQDDTQIFPTHKDYGFVYLSSRALSSPVFSSMMITLDSGTSINHMKQTIEDTLPNAAAVIKLSDLPTDSVYQGEIEEGETYVGVFSGMFLFIAMLSVVTTMHRIVKKQRIQIGTLKALGFTDRHVLLHYMGYGFWISLAAAILGVICGPLLLGRMFLKMELEMFQLPDIKSVITYPSWIIAFLVVLVVVLISYLSARKQLKQTPSETLRTQSVRKKETSHFSFGTTHFQKAGFPTRWNLRDIMRNRLRTIMGLAGITGCCMLLVCAFGLLNTMNNYIDWQFESLSHFNTKFAISSAATVSERNQITSQYGNASSMTLGIEFQNGARKETSSIFVTDADDKVRFTDHNRSFMTLKDGGIYITEKLAETLGVTTGDTLKWHVLGNDSYYESKVLGLNRDPQNQIASMTRASLEELGLTYQMDTLYLKQTIAEKTSIAGVERIQSKETIKNSMVQMLSSMKTMVIIIIIAAAVLGSVILYNLGILSFNEKQYQFATLKVLGFRERRIRSIFVLQNIWITIIAIAAGLPLGYFMLDFIYRSALSDSFDFSAYIHISSYVAAVIGTFLMSLLINFILSRKVASIDMVSSLKSDE